MPISISFELSDNDLEHFNQAIAKAGAAALLKPIEEVLEAAGKLLIDADTIELPDFIAQRLDKLNDMIAMLRDDGWHLPEEDQRRVLSALGYLADPDDIIPDNVPVLGYLDDAIVIEMCVKELKHELDAYDEFCDFRQGEAQRRGLEPAQVGRVDWLESRRDELVDRMHRRRNHDVGTGYGSSSGYERKGYTSSAWRPGMMRVR